MRHIFKINYLLTNTILNCEKEVEILWFLGRECNTETLSRKPPNLNTFINTKSSSKAVLCIIIKSKKTPVPLLYSLYLRHRFIRLVKNKVMSKNEIIINSLKYLDGSSKDDWFERGRGSNDSPLQIS